MTFYVCLDADRVTDLCDSSVAPPDAVPVRVMACDPRAIASQAYLRFDAATGALTYDTAAEALDAAWASLRAERNRRLAASDIRVLPDRWAQMTTATRAAWTAYRQTLRDLPEQITDPTQPVDWPVEPT